MTSLLREEERPPDAREPVYCAGCGAEWQPTPLQDLLAGEGWAFLQRAALCPQCLTGPHSDERSAR